MFPRNNFVGQCKCERECEDPVFTVWMVSFKMGILQNTEIRNLETRDFKNARKIFYKYRNFFLPVPRQSLTRAIPSSAQPQG